MDEKEAEARPLMGTIFLVIQKFEMEEKPVNIDNSVSLCELPQES